MNLPEREGADYGDLAQEKSKERAVRQRAAQLPAIANIYLSYLNTALAKQIFGLEAEAMTQLQEFDWPHNYTQFQRILQELAQMTHGNYITAQEVQEVLRRERTMATVNKLV